MSPAMLIHHGCSQCRLIGRPVAQITAHEISWEVIICGRLDRRCAVVTGTASGQNMTPEAEAEWTDRAPLGRWGIPEDVAEVASFFASDEGAYVTGQALAVDGGILIVA